MSAFSPTLGQMKWWRPPVNVAELGEANICHGRAWEVVLCAVKPGVVGFSSKIEATLPMEDEYRWDRSGVDCLGRAGEVGIKKSVLEGRSRGDYELIRSVGGGTAPGDGRRSYQEGKAAWRARPERADTAYTVSPRFIAPPPASASDVDCPFCIKDNNAFLRLWCGKQGRTLASGGYQLPSFEY